MKENDLLDKTLEILENKGIENAYYFLVDAAEAYDNLGSQTYNYLYCLASLSGKTEEALSWLEEAVIEKNYWYRPEVFYDGDLDGIRFQERFVRCMEISNKRYYAESQKAATVSTWNSVKGSDIFLVLHGNQENISIARRDWDFLQLYGKQVEYIQSKELDSSGLYRWEENGSGPMQVYGCISAIDWDSYENHVLCGFSAGCNVILSAIEKDYVKPEAIILQSPWIPVVASLSDSIIKRLVDGGIKVLFICGKQDVDCIPFVSFVRKAKSFGADITEEYIEGLAHTYPGNFEEIVVDFLEGPASSRKSSLPGQV